MGQFGALKAAFAASSTDPVACDAISEADNEVERRFRFVPDGYAEISQTIVDAPEYPGIDVEVGAYRLAQHTVTNAEFQWFVDAGGYGDLALWPRDLWEQRNGFRDLTGHQAPRFWRHGRHDETRANHPVVGICYYEANAYARWAGFRLPTEEEWQVAATWRLRSLAHMPSRFPWGDAVDTRYCNVWISGISDTVDVAAYADGTPPNGVQQLIGNVWEWTSSDYNVTDAGGRHIVGDMPLKSVRGGAYDTYLATQASGAFRTGLAVLVRMPNVGFRCATDPGTSSSGEPVS
jgi:iron(II)-dependent oxidoreductase